MSFSSLESEIIEFSYLCTMFMKTFRILVITVAFFISALQAYSFDKVGVLGLHFGPNLNWTSAANTGIVWGQWLPQITTAVDFNWIEPLGDALPYGEDLDPKAAYLRFQAGLELSPFYENVTMGMGITPFPIRPQISFRFQYDHLVYFNTNVEMVMASSAEDKGNQNIAETWDTQYILENIFEKDEASLDFAQSFTFGLDLDYISRTGMMVGFHFNFALIDITTDFEGKSYDYRRNIPVFSRDYLFELNLYGRFPLLNSLSLLYEMDFYKTGISRSGKNINKESLSYGKILAGGEFAWGESKKHRLTLTPGFFARGKSRFYDGNLGQQFIIQIEYHRTFGIFDFFK